jgi:phosphate/sulfate permease
MAKSASNSNEGALQLAVLAGLCGGLAEVLWVGGYGYAGFSPLSGSEVARQITASIVPAAADSPLAVAFGIVIHFLLSALLGLTFAWLIWRPFLRKRGVVGTLLGSVAVLTLVWGVNFFAVLPFLNPAFVVLMPYGVTLASKIMFGIVMGLVLQVEAVGKTGRRRLRDLNCRVPDRCPVSLVPGGGP